MWGEVNFEGGNRKKADLIKGGIKFGQNMVRGEGNYKFVQGGIRFLIIRMYNKVLNGQSKPCLQDLLSEQHHAKQLSVSYIFPYVPDSLLLEHLKLSCGIHNFSLNLNIDFLEIITS